MGIFYHPKNHRYDWIANYRGIVVTMEGFDSQNSNKNLRYVQNHIHRLPEINNLTRAIKEVRYVNALVTLFFRNQKYNPLHINYLKEETFFHYNSSKGLIPEKFISFLLLIIKDTQGIYLTDKESDGCSKTLSPISKF